MWGWGRRALQATLVTAVVGAIAVTAYAEEAEETTEKFDRDTVEVALGASTMMRLRGSVGQVTLTDPTVADVSKVGSRLLIIGRRVGETNLILSSGGSHTTWLVKVTLPARAIQQELARMFPREDIGVRAVGGSLVLTGTVATSEVPGQAEDVAVGYLRSPSIAALGVKPHVINLVRVRAKLQVLLEVRFAEVNRKSVREMGINAFVSTDKSKDRRVGGAIGRRMNFEAGTTRQGDSWPPNFSTLPPQSIFSSNNAIGTLFAGKEGGSFPFVATLSLLASHDLAKTLAEPTLTAMSGQTASFIAGGEVPVPVSNGFSTTVEFKKFGIELSFTPTVLEDKTIHLKTKTAVSAPDPTLSIVVNQVATPGFKRRATETVVRMRDGQSFAIAGLLSNEMENLVEKVPGLGDLPILGILFSSKEFERRETELVVVITAKLIEPLDTSEMPPLPGGDRINDPTDLELFLLNIGDPDVEVRGPKKTGDGLEQPVRRRRRPSGKLGFWR